LFPITGYFVLSFFPETNPMVIGLNAVCSVVELLLTFWIGIILVLLVNAILEKQTLDIATLKQTSISLLQPVANALLIAFLFVLLGILLLVLPGIMVFIWIAFTQTVVILDGKRGMDALKSSKSLSEGRFFRVFYRILIGPLFIGFIFSLITALVLSLSGAISGFNPIDVASTQNLPAWVDLLQSTIEIFGIPWLATYMILLYKHLKETLNSTQS